jgi:hypothetical protein
VKRWPRVLEVRPTRVDDGPFFDGVAWVAVDSNGYRHGGDTEAAARQSGEDYNRPPRRARHQHDAGAIA